MAAPLKTLDFVITAGKKLKPIAFTWGIKNASTGVVTPNNPTGYILRINVRSNALSDVLIASFSSVSGEHLGGAEGTITLLGAVTNNITLAMTATETAKLQGKAGTYRYDCNWGPSGSDPEPFFTGTITVEDGYTR